MRAKRIFVITLGFDTSGELINGAKSLANRMLSHAADGVAFIRVTSHQNWQVDLETRQRKNPFEGIDTEQDIGVYLIGHHGGRPPTVGIGGYTAENVVALLTHMGFTHIRKLCLLACFIDEHNTTEPGAARHLKQEASKRERIGNVKEGPTKEFAIKGLTDQMEKLQNTAQASYMGTLAKLLAAAGIKPMIAGWDSFVTVAYPENVTIPKDSVFRAPENDGRKVVASRGAYQKGLFVFASPKDKEEVKKDYSKTVVRWEQNPDGGGKLVLVPDGWSDKDPDANR
jgi:hypothetical protein